MASFIIVVLIIISASSAINSKNPGVCYSEDDSYFYFPGDGDGTIHLINRRAYMTNAKMDFFEETNNNSYDLYTRMNTNESQVLVFQDEKSIVESNFDTSKVTVFLAHGWRGHGRNHMNLLLIEAFLQNNDVNVIVLDYSSVADIFYITAVPLIPQVGYHLGKFIIWLTELGVSYENIHLVGFSLGAHVVGNAGRETKGRVKRITALDPAGPLWYSNDNCLAKTDAEYVEIIHTNTFSFGHKGLLGHADFFPNGGSVMPGCSTNLCSHSISYEYMALTLKSRISSHQCKDMDDVDSNTCNGHPLSMGNSDMHKYGVGIFRANIEDTNFGSVTSMPMLNSTLDSNACL